MSSESTTPAAGAADPYRRVLDMAERSLDEAWRTFDAAMDAVDQVRTTYGTEDDRFTHAREVAATAGWTAIQARRSLAELARATQDVPPPPPTS
jgi:hypothetical protein